MLCKKLKAYNVTCGPTSGGVARIWLFDGEDFTFTQAAADADGNKPAYTAIALRTGAEAADGALMFPIKFNKNEAELSYKQSRKGCSVKYEHQLEFNMSNLSQLITQWNENIDAAGCCCGVGLMIQLNSGKIFVAGEKYVGGNVVNIPMEMKQDGSSGTSGKLLDDANQQVTILKGELGRTLYEYTGTVQSIVDLETE